MSAADIHSLEPAIAQSARELFQAVDRREKEMSIGESWEDKILDWSMGDADRKTRILRFIDVFPSLKTDREVVDHLKHYFPAGEQRLPLALRAGLKMSGGLLTSRWVAAAVRILMKKMARRFIGGETPAEAVACIKELGSAGFSASLDFLGEATLSENEADQNLESAVLMIETLAKSALQNLQADKLVNYSIKCSSLTSLLDPADPASVGHRLLPRLRTLLRAATSHDAFIHFDAENFEVCDLTLDLLLKLFEEPEFKRGPGAGVVLQAYLRDAEDRAARIMRWCAKTSRPLTVRLVKGAYWDSEIIRARECGWPAPVYARKEHSDAAFERILLGLMESHKTVRTAVASHNIRSIAAAVAISEQLRVPPDRLEFQFLYGMARATRAVLADRGFSVRVYTPYGQLIPGMAYLVRRLLENSSNESFLRHRRLGNLSADGLLKNPHDKSTGGAREERVHPEIAQLIHGLAPSSVVPSSLLSPDPDAFINAPAAAFHLAPTRTIFQNAVHIQMFRPPEKIAPLIDGKSVTGQKMPPSVNPSHPSQVIAEVVAADGTHVEDAVRTARSAWKDWRKTRAADRGRILRKAADLLTARRDEFAALEVCEAGKPWGEAQADVAEAIDYLRYYSVEAERLEKGLRFQPEIPGETNTGSYRPRGVAVVISPWNFPLAIPAGQITAALATGNCVLFKPAEQTPLIAYRWVRLLHEAGIPTGVLHFLPGTGEEIGPELVEDPNVDVIAFTGSRAVGEEILKRASAKNSPSGPKRVIAEMGGKNAVIVDSDADFDLAIAECLQAAFDYAGQKCSALSRLILLDDIYDAFLNRFADATKTYPAGPAENPCTKISPLIDEQAQKRVRTYFATATREGRWVLPPDDTRIPKEGFFVPPAIVAVKSADAAVSQEEIFGPLVTVLSAKTLEEAVEMANGTAYALTGGFFSRHPGHIEYVRRELDAGNIYINRSITGAEVGRQPFGGHRASGVGSKAGGPEYLAQFCVPVTVSENISRHGFSPDVSH